MKPELKSDPDIHVFYHVAQFKKWKEISLNQSRYLCDSGLMCRVSKIHVGVVGDKYEDCFGFLPKDFLDKSEFHFFGPFCLYEFPTLNMIHKHSTNNNSYVLYIHTKGVSKRREILHRWCEYMMHYCAGKWQECIKRLETHDVCGVQLSGTKGLEKKGVAVGSKGIMAGNFWWSKSEYIRTLPRISEINTSNRYEAEAWVGRGNPSWSEMRNIKLSSLGGDNWRNLLK